MVEGGEGVWLRLVAFVEGCDEGFYFGVGGGVGEGVAEDYFCGGFLCGVLCFVVWLVVGAVWEADRSGAVRCAAVSRIR